MSFTKPDTTSEEYKLLWANLTEEQRDCLVKYNRVPVRGKDGCLYVIPYSRYHDDSGITNRQFHQVSVQQFKKTKDGRDVFNFIRCGGIGRTHAALNVLGIKLSLEAPKGGDYISQSNPLDSFLYNPFRGGMTFEETLEIEVNSIPILREKPR